MIVRSISLKSSAFLPQQLPQDDLPKIVFVGRSNVGKSSMINCLLAQKNLARTSSRPGKTMSVNSFLVNGAFYFIDLPGYGYAHAGLAERQRMRRLLGEACSRLPGVSLVCLLVDARRGLLPADLEFVSGLLEKKLPILTILTKGDKLSTSDLKNQIIKFKKFRGIDVIAFSAKTRLGRTEIWEMIAEAQKER